MTSSGVVIVCVVPVVPGVVVGAVVGVVVGVVGGWLSFSSDELLLLSLSESLSDSADLSCLGARGRPVNARY